MKYFQSVCQFGTRIYLNSLKRNVRCVNDGNYLLWNSFCTITESLQVDESLQKTESPKLPDWVKSRGKSSDNDDDDFVPPSVSHWIENDKFHNKKAYLESTVSESAETDVDKVSKILKCQFKSPDDVVEALNGLSVDVTKSLIEQNLKRFSFDSMQTLGLFKWAKLKTGFKCSGDLYDLVVDNLGKTRKFDLMWEVVEEMKQLEGYITFPTIRTVIRRLAKAGKLDDSVEVFRNLERYGVDKDVVAMNFVMDALVKERAVERAEKVYLEFKHNIPPNIYTFNILVHGWCKARKMEEAKKTLDEMKKHGFDPDVITYTSFLEAYCREKDFHKVDATLEEMHRKGLNPNAVTYTVIMNALGKAKEIKRALDIYEKMKQDSCVPDNTFYSSLILNLSKFGRLKDAREVFEDMARQGVAPEVGTYNAMVAAFVQHSKEEDALMLLGQMEEGQCTPDLYTYAPLLKMCCRLKRMKVLSFLLNHMFKNNVSIDLGTYSLLVNRLCINGSLDRACSFFEEAVKRGFVPTDSMYEKLVGELQKKEMDKEKEWIEEVMQQAKQQASVDSPNIQDQDKWTKGSLVHACDFFEKAVKRGFVPPDSMYEKLVRELQKKEMDRKKEQVEELMQQAKQQASVDSPKEVNEDQDKWMKRSLDEACSFFEKAVEKGFVPTHSTYEKLMKKLQLKKMATEKQRVEELMQKTKQQVSVDSR